MKLILKPNELIIRAGNSCLHHLDKLVHGKLIVTNQRIYFKSLEESTRECDLEISPADIQDLVFYNSRWLIPNGINIITKSGCENRFTLSNRTEWARIITRMF